MHEPKANCLQGKQTRLPAVVAHALHPTQAQLPLMFQNCRLPTSEVQAVRYAPVRLKRSMFVQEYTLLHIAHQQYYHSDILHTGAFVYTFRVASDSDATGMFKPLRRYQRQALEQIARGSSIVVLPTGAGKTLIAARAAETSLASTGKPTLFLVPTTNLVNQQKEAFEAETRMRVARYRGGLAAPDRRSFDALVATPEAALQLVRQHKLEFWDFGMVIFDEVHHTVKQHPYMKAAACLQGLPQSHKPKVVGLSASLTYSLHEEEIENDVLSLCEDLCLSGHCIYIASEEQLLEDGYRGNQATTQLTSPAQHFSIPIPNFKMKLKSHYLMGDFLAVVQKRDIPPLHPLTLQLFDCIEWYENVAGSELRVLPDGKRGHYKSPIHGMPPVPLRDWGSSIVKQQTSEELISASRIKPGVPSTTGINSTSANGGTTTNRSHGQYHGSPSTTSSYYSASSTFSHDCYHGPPVSADHGSTNSADNHGCSGSRPPWKAVMLLEHLYEAAAIIVKSSQSNLELGMIYLEMMGVLREGRVAGGALGALTDMWGKYENEMYRAAHLQEVLEQVAKEHKDKLRCIIFVQDRVTTHILEYILNRRSSALIRSLPTACIYATNSPVSQQFRVTKSQANSRIDKFARGDVTVLLSTSFAEEGLDIQAANCVIRFDEVQTSVSLVQSRGRARQTESSFLLMKGDQSKPIAKLQEAEHTQRRVIEKLAAKGLPHRPKIHPPRSLGELPDGLGFDNMNINVPGNATAAGIRVLRRFRENEDACRQKARGMLNEYAQLYGSQVLEEDMRKVADGLWESSLLLTGIGTGADIRGTGRASGKKMATQAAAFSIMQQLTKHVLVFPL